MTQSQGGAYGTGPQAPLRFEGESKSENQASISVGASAFYDDNVIATNKDRLSDEAISLSSNLDVEKQTSNMLFSFDYLPYFLIYRQISQYDRLNHDANANFAYRLSPRVVLGLHDSFGYQTGVLPGITGQSILAGLPPPTSLNQGVFSYTTRVLSNVAGLDLTFVKSRRHSLTLSADYQDLSFGSQVGAAESLYNGTGGSLGLQYQYRAAAHTTLGVLLLHQDTTYRGGTGFGNSLRSQIESAYVSLGFRESPTVTITVFGGPQFVRILGASSTQTSLGSSFQAAGGGSITKQARGTAFDLSFARSVSDSGGLYTSVINTYIGFGVRRHLFGRWDGDLNGGLSRADASLFQNVNGLTNAITAGIDFNRPIREGSTLHISYYTTHQVSSGQQTIFSDFDRNQVTVSIDFRLKTISLGH